MGGEVTRGLVLSKIGFVFLLESSCSHYSSHFTLVLSR